MVLSYSFNAAKDLVHQTATQCSKFGCPEVLILQMVRISLTRELIPVNLGLTLGLLSPLLSIFAYSMVGRSELPIINQENVLVRTHVKSLLMVTPVLCLCGITAAMIAVYSGSSYKNISDLIDFVDYIQSISRSLALGLALSGLAFLQIKMLYKITKLGRRIAVCVISILVNYLAIIALNVGIGYLVGNR